MDLKTFRFLILDKQEMDTKEVDEFKRLDEKVKHHTTWEEPEHGQVGDSGTALHTPSIATNVRLFSIMQGIANLLSLLFQPGNE